MTVLGLQVTPAVILRGAVRRCRRILGFASTKPSEFRDKASELHAHGFRDCARNDGLGVLGGLTLMTVLGSQVH